MFTKYETLTPGELRPGMIAAAHGMRVLITEPPRKTNHAGDRTFATRGTVLNRDAVSPDAVPYSFTTPHLPNGYPDTELIAQGVHVWTFQGNDLARVAVEVAWVPTQAEDEHERELRERLAQYAH